MTAQFLPIDYVAPMISGGYTKLQKGVNKIRILSAPIIGWLDWVEKKPLRYRMEDKPEKWIDAERPGKHFWAMIVYNYDDKKIQIWEVTQNSIRKAIQALAEDSDWGAPYYYDIKVTREGEGLKTHYTINPLPHKTASKETEKAFYETPCRLEALFDGLDPFSTWDEYTPGVFGNPEESKKQKIVDINDKDLTKPSQGEIDAFFDSYAEKYDKKKIDQYIEKRSKHFGVSRDETIALIVQDTKKFEQEFDNWSNKQK